MLHFGAHGNGSPGLPFTEVACVVRTRSGDDDSHLLLDTLPRSRGVTGITAQCVLHTYFGGVLSLVNKSGTLTPDQVAALQPPALEPRVTEGTRVTEGDGALLACVGVAWVHIACWLRVQRGWVILIRAGGGR